MNAVAGRNFLHFEEYLLGNLLGFCTHPSPIHRIARFITLGNFFAKKCFLKYMQSILATSQWLLLGELQGHLSCEKSLLFSVVKLKVAHAAFVKSICSLKMGKTLFPVQKGEGRVLFVRS